MSCVIIENVHIKMCGGCSGGVDGFLGLQLYNTQSQQSVYQLHVSLRSSGERGRAEGTTEARRLFKSNTGYLGFIGDWTKACVKGFLSHALCHVLQTAVWRVI